MADPRIVSLLPAATEIVCALGAGAALAAISHECDYPDDIRHLPRITEARIPDAEGNQVIHDHVRDLVSRGLAIYNVDAPALRALAPDVIVTQTQCHLCAASPQDLASALAEWTGKRPQIVSLEALTLDGILTDMAHIAAAIGRPEPGEALLSDLRDRIDRARQLARARAETPSVGVLEWLAPLMAGGNWMPELVEIAGCRPVWGETGVHSPWLNSEQLEADDPEILLLVPCGFDLARARHEVSALKTADFWPGLKAVRHNKVFVGDGNAYFNRPGPRIAESIEIMFEIAHGIGTGMALSGKGWERLD